MADFLSAVQYDAMKLFYKSWTSVPMYHTPYLYVKVVRGAAFKMVLHLEDHVKQVCGCGFKTLSEMVYPNKLTRALLKG